MKKILKTFVDTIKDPDLLSSQPHHGEWDDDTQMIMDDNENIQEQQERTRLLTEHDSEPEHQGWENDDKCCPNCGFISVDECGLVLCRCDAQGLSEQEIESLTCLIISADYTWEHQQPGIPSQKGCFSINEDTKHIYTTTLRVGNLLVTVQEMKDEHINKPD